MLKPFKIRKAEHGSATTWSDCSRTKPTAHTGSGIMVNTKGTKYTKKMLIANSSLLSLSVSSVVNKILIFFAAAASWVVVVIVVDFGLLFVLCLIFVARLFGFGCMSQSSFLFLPKLPIDYYVSRSKLFCPSNRSARKLQYLHLAAT
jgi:hypothetical protein